MQRITHVYELSVGDIVSLYWMNSHRGYFLIVHRDWLVTVDRPYHADGTSTRFYEGHLSVENIKVYKCSN